MLHTGRRAEPAFEGTQLDLQFCPEVKKSCKSEVATFVAALRSQSK